MLERSVVSTIGPGGPCDEEGEVYEGDVALPGSGELVDSVVSTNGPGDPCDETGSGADAPVNAIFV